MREDILYSAIRALLVVFGSEMSLNYGQSCLLAYAYGLYSLCDFDHTLRYALALDHLDSISTHDLMNSLHV